MATYQHPGVYIEEFTPASPIEGVGTSTAGFIGVSSSGPIMIPTPITSWDGFREVFGDHVEETFPGGDKPWLALAVKGFFLNGGTTCYVVRASSAVNASAELTTRNTPNNATIIARARTEGSSANGITVTPADRSLSHDALGADLNVHRKSTVINAMPNRRTLTVAANAGFAAGDAVTLEKTAAGPAPALPAVNAVIDGLTATNTLTLKMPLAGTDNYSGGTVRIADLVPGTTTIRVDVPAKPLRQVLSPGSLVEIDVGKPAAEWRVVAAVGTDSVTLRTPLTALHAMSAAIAIASREFDLHIADPRTGWVEDLVGLATDPGHPNWWGGKTSTIITLEPPDLPPGGSITDPRPAIPTVTLDGGTDDARAKSWAALVALPDDALATLAPIDDVAIVAIPGATSLSAHQSIVTHCELLGDRVAILDSTRGIDPQAVVSEARNATGTNRGFAALYYPWIQIVNTVTRRAEPWPPSAHLAGVYARTDTERGVHKAPANTTIRGAVGLARRLTDADQDSLNPHGVSALRVPPNGGAPMVWGARTTTTQDRNWQYVNIRRLFNYLEESIADGIRWAVFEPNDTSLWKKLERSIGAFLKQTWRDGALFGLKAEQAYYVRIDEALNPQSTRSLGRLYIEIGVQPVYPAEFIVVRIGIWDGGSETSES
jgi:phage tail sheath protein FI